MYVRDRVFSRILQSSKCCLNKPFSYYNFHYMYYHFRVFRSNTSENEHIHQKKVQFVMNDIFCEQGSHGDWKTWKMKMVMEKSCNMKN